jgi:hypothetical protein
MQIRNSIGDFNSGKRLQWVPELKDPFKTASARCVFAQKGGF